MKPTTATLAARKRAVAARRAARANRVRKKRGKARRVALAKFLSVPVEMLERALETVGEKAKRKVARGKEK